MTAYNEDSIESEATSPVTIALDSASENNIPQIVSKPVEAGKVEEPYQYDGDATDLDGNTLTYSLLSLPAE